MHQKLPKIAMPLLTAQTGLQEDNCEDSVEEALEIKLEDNAGA